MESADVKEVELKAEQEKKLARVAVGSPYRRLLAARDKSDIHGLKKLPRHCCEKESSLKIAAENWWYSSGATRMGYVCQVESSRGKAGGLKSLGKRKLFVQLVYSKLISRYFAILSFL